MARLTMSYMQKDRPQSVKVRPITAIERAPSLGAARRIAFKTADDRTVQLWPCATQTMQPRLQGVQGVQGMQGVQGQPGA